MRKWSWLGLVLSSCVLPSVGLVDSFNELDDAARGGNGGAGTSSVGGAAGKQAGGGDMSVSDAGQGGSDSNQPLAGSAGSIANAGNGSGGTAGNQGLGGGGADNNAVYDDGTFTIWAIGGVVPEDITMGLDQNLWFTVFGGNIGRMSPDGELTVFPLPSGRRGFMIISGPDGQLWFTDNSPQGMSRITTTGVLSEIPLTDAAASPEYITRGPDGNVWGSCFYADLVIRMTPQGVLTKFTLSEPPDAGVNSIAADADGNLWFGMSYRSKIGRITTAGASSAFDLTNSTVRAGGVVQGADGNVWYASTGSVGKITSQGQAVDFNVAVGHDITRPAVGADGAMWFWDITAAKLLRVTVAGDITTHDAPPNTTMWSLTAGPDDKLWFTDRQLNHVGRIDISNLP